MIFRPTPRAESRSETGAAAEHAAEQWLLQRGLTTVARNWRCKAGEIDRIMFDGKTLVFVEVRCRSNPDFGGAAASVTRAKQRRLLRAAELYLLQHAQYQQHTCRFDVMLATSPQTDNWQWLQDAFSGY